MNIFKKINDEQKSNNSLPTEPNELFYILKKENGYSYLRGIQEEALNSWHKRRTESNLLIKMNTGAGKTLVGLIILYSKLLELNKKTIFLCSDKQLVNQVYKQSFNYGIPTCIIDSDNEFPEDFLNNKSILITTVQKLFNGKNIFDKHHIDLGCIVIDDAHKCCEKIQDSFAITFNENHDAYKELFNLFGEELKKQAIGSYESIKSGHPDYYMKLPFWSWLDNKERVINILSKYIQETETLLFVWDLFFNNYNQYELFISSSKIELIPIKCFVENIRSYASADFKYALSATFENDISLMYDLDFSQTSIELPIEPKDRKDYGQRLILSPKRYFKDFSQDHLIKIIKHHLINNENILVLVPSFKEAKIWETLGAKSINVDISNELEKLRTSKGNFVVLANRYDGIDLGGDACNILIIHEHPKYKYLKSKYLENILHTTSSNLIAQTIEQGLGRTVRSGNDYSVIYLLGKNILRFLRHKDNFKYLNKHTKKQIEIGLDLLSNEQVKPDDYAKALYDTADFCLSQNEEWLKYYQAFMQKKDDESEDIDKQKILTIKSMEKEAIKLFINGKNEDSVALINQILAMDLPNSERAIYLQLCSNITYLFDKNYANDLIIKSREFSRHMFEPFLSKSYHKKHLKTSNQHSNALKFLNLYATMNDAIDSLNEMLSNLKLDPNNDSEDFEEALNNLGRLLGFYSIRPEKDKNEGPDNLWLFENNICLIMESKSEKEYRNIISKSDISQLLHSLEWFDSKYINKDAITFGVTVQYNRKKEKDVVIRENIRVLDNINIKKLQNALGKYIQFLSNYKISELNEEMIRTEFLANNFSSNLFVDQYLTKII